MLSLLFLLDLLSYCFCEFDCQALLVSGASDGLLVLWSADNSQDSRELVPKLSLKVCPLTLHFYNYFICWFISYYVDMFYGYGFFAKLFVVAHFFILYSSIWLFLRSCILKAFTCPSMINIFICAP